MARWSLIPQVCEPFASVSHYIGAFLFSVLGFLLLRKLWGDWSRFGYMSVFVVTTVLLLLMSGTYHIMDRETIERVFWVRLDVSAIFLLIAGSFTFLHGCLFNGWQRWGMLGPIWLLAVLGILMTMRFDHEDVKQLTRFYFLGMGWLGLFSCGLLRRTYGRRVIDHLLIGGVIFTVGAVVDGVKWPSLIQDVIGPHELLHICVLLAVGIYWKLAFEIANGNVSRIDLTSTA